MKVAAPATLRGRTIPEEEESGRTSHTSPHSPSAIRLREVSGFLLSGVHAWFCKECFEHSRCLINVRWTNKGAKPVSLPPKNIPLMSEVSCKLPPQQHCSCSNWGRVTLVIGRGERIWDHQTLLLLPLSLSFIFCYILGFFFILFLLRICNWECWDWPALLPALLLTASSTQIWIKPVIVSVLDKLL